MKTLGAVLAGGRSSRFGSDKAAALLAGQSLLDHALAALRPHVDAVVVVGRAIEGQPMIADWPAPDLGPMGGIAGALRHAEAAGFDQLLCISVDCVRLPADLRALLTPAPAYLASQPVISRRVRTTADRGRRPLGPPLRQQHRRAPRRQRFCPAEHQQCRRPRPRDKPISPRARSR
ncbi:MAG: molybdenum cofactor guanylyltransferase [Sphingopyxis sp.]